MPRQRKVQEVVPVPEDVQVVEVESVPTEVIVEEAGELLAEEPQELSEQEQQERERLEQQIVNSFYQAGMALRELRDKRLFRSTHKSFEEYAKAILGFTRIRLYQLMGAARVYENIRRNVNAPLTSLPTTEYQCRPLVKLSEKEQIKAWQIALERAGEKTPTSVAVRQAVLEIEQRAAKKKPIPFAVNDVVRIRVKENPELAGLGGHLAVVKEVKSVSCVIESALGERVVHPQHLESAGLKPEVEEETRQLVHRLANLHEQRVEDALVGYLLRYYAIRELLTADEEEVLKVLEGQGKSMVRVNEETEGGEIERS